MCVAESPSGPGARCEMFQPPIVSDALICQRRSTALAPARPAAWQRFAVPFVQTIEGGKKKKSHSYVPLSCPAFLFLGGELALLDDTLEYDVHVANDNPACRMDE